MFTGSTVAERVKTLFKKSAILSLKETVKVTSYSFVLATIRHNQSEIISLNTFDMFVYIPISE